MWLRNISPFLSSLGPFLDSSSSFSVHFSVVNPMAPEDSTNQGATFHSLRLHYRMLFVMVPVDVWLDHWMGDGDDVMMTCVGLLCLCFWFHARMPHDNNILTMAAYDAVHFILFWWILRLPFAWFIPLLVWIFLRWVVRISSGSKNSGLHNILPSIRGCGKHRKDCKQLPLRSS